LSAQPQDSLTHAGAAVETRDPRLDGLRGFAILLVVLYHTTHYGLARGTFDTALTIVPSLGWSGVDLFFVLSGFLITSILLVARDGDSYYRAFYARRVLRIFPLYYATLAFFLLVVPQIRLFASADYFWNPGAHRETIWYWLFLSNVQAALAGSWQHQTLDITWSLAIEEHFYLIWPFVVRRASDRRLLQICAGTIAGALLLRVLLVAMGASPLAVYALTPCRLDTLATGAALAILARRAGGLASLAGTARVVLAGAFALLAVLQTWIRLHQPEVSGYEAITRQTLQFNNNPLMQTLGFTLLCAFYGALLVSVCTAPAGSWRARTFEMEWLRRFGLYSYAIYLFHFFIALLALSVFTPGHHPDHFALAQLFYWMLVIGVTYGLARASWFLLEERALRWKRFFPYRV
jgi:peptidoglycan/LPS O-acetylase OafA/YrhL